MLQNTALFKFLGILVFLVTLSCISQPALSAEYNCSNCSDCSSRIQSASSWDTIKLNASITNQDGNCIEFNGADNVTFDCDGFTIGGDGDSAGIGIYLSDSNGGSNNTIIKNCINVSYFWNGIELDHSHNNTLINVTVSSNNFKGIHIDDSSNNTLINITANENWIAIELFYGSSNTTIKNANITKNDTTADYEQNMGLMVYGFSLEEFVHNIDTSNTVNGKAIQYFDGTYRSCPDNQTLDYNTSASFVGLVGCDNITINNTYVNDQILLAYTNNSLVNNSMANCSYVGLNLYSSYYNNITSFSGLGNMDAGILFWYSLYNIITNTTVSNNSGDGIEFYSSSYNELTNITANNNSYGVAFYSCNNSTLTNITTNNNFGGLLFCDSSSNNITNLNSSGNERGIWIEDESYYNIIKDSWIENSTGYGIRFEHSGSDYPQNNTIYNNYFNNTVNFNSTSDQNTNYWNTTLNCSAGPNILGGPCIGGNYWTNASGDGFSDTCTDQNGDGICDVNYDLYSSNTDWLPLSAPQPIACYSCSDCSNKIQSANSGDVIKLSTNILDYTGSCIIFDGKDNITFDCGGYYIDGIYNSGTEGIYFNYSDNGSNNNIIKNCNNITAFQVGVWIYYSYNNTLINITSYDNEYGIIIEGGSSNTVINFTSEENYYDQILIASDNNTLKNIFVSTNWDADNDGAVYLTNSDYNYFENITIKQAPDIGFYLTVNSTNNTINDSRIESCTNYGIYIADANSSYNLFYNNYFNNINNVNITSGAKNYWNTTKTAGTNIIGGPYIGGNYWSDYTGQDTDGDKIGETPHVLDSNNTDYLPLTFTTYAPPPPGDGFMGTLYGGPLPETEEATYTSDVIYEGETVEVIVNDTDIPISNITFVVGETVTNASLDVEKETEPSDVSQPPGDVYGYFTINTSISDDQISEAVIHFRVEISWIESNNIDPEDVVLWRYHNNNWQYIGTEIEGSDSEYYYYFAIIPGFSLFVITYEELVCIPDSRRCSDDELQRCKSDGSGWETIETCEYGCDNESISCKPRERVCEPEGMRCDGNVLQKCSADGYTWETLETCGYQCVDNRCVGPPYYYVGIAVILVVLVLLVVIKLGLFKKPKKKKKGTKPHIVPVFL